jgi:hypothetical protein
MNGDSRGSYTFSTSVSGLFDMPANYEELYLQDTAARHLSTLAPFAALETDCTRESGRLKRRMDLLCVISIEKRKEGRR